MKTVYVVKMFSYVSFTVRIDSCHVNRESAEIQVKALKNNGCDACIESFLLHDLTIIEELKLDKSNH